MPKIIFMIALIVTGADGKDIWTFTDNQVAFERKADCDEVRKEFYEPNVRTDCKPMVVFTPDMVRGAKRK